MRLTKSMIVARAESAMRAAACHADADSDWAAITAAHTAVGRLERAHGVRIYGYADTITLRWTLDSTEVDTRKGDTMTVTNEQIEKMSAEAAEAGDLAQVRICERALAGDKLARAECARAISNAEAQR